MTALGCRSRGKSERHAAMQRKKDGHVTPEWELWGNEKFLCGNLLK